MGKIRILPDELVSKIAAGEIVERPASVLKELVENSLDAGSSSVRIELRGGGRRLVKVTDDGPGMSRDEALLAIERNSTSKLRSAAELENIRTLGFRGEALPSIAGVSRFTLITKTPGSMIGTRITINGGKVKRVEETGCPHGTTVEVRDLFFNTPARLKFMRSRERELSQAVDVLQRLAVSSTGVGFELISDGRALFRLPGRESAEDRIKELWGEAELHPFEAEAPNENTRVSGYLGEPDSSRTTSQKLYISVNGRAVKDRYITRMATDAYGRLLERGKYPQGVIMIDLPPSQVDVNVHPAKAEVRFRKYRLVGDLIRSAVAQMIENAPWVGDYARSVHASESPTGGVYTENIRYSQSAHEEHGVYKADRIDPFEAHEHHSAPYHAEEASGHTSEYPPGPKPPGSGFVGDGELLDRDGGYFSSMRVVGQVGGLFIICESPGRGAVIIDQHAAHERINYERLKRSYLSGRLETQELLIPVVVELSPSEAELARGCLGELSTLGFEAQEFGDNSIRIRSVPALLAITQPEGLIRDILGEIGELEGEKSMSALIDKVIATMACHSSIRASDVLEGEKIRALLEELDRCDFPHACPHGRPVAKEITFGELERMFKRT
ncbi:MAG: DNA mismatch repair endonuclease MutL [Thermodesulfobacteriota bacterium]